MTRATFWVQPTSGLSVPHVRTKCSLTQQLILETFMVTKSTNLFCLFLKCVCLYADLSLHIYITRCECTCISEHKLDIFQISFCLVPIPPKLFPRRWSEGLGRYSSFANTVSKNLPRALFSGTENHWFRLLSSCFKHFVSTMQMYLGHKTRNSFKGLSIQ